MPDYSIFGVGVRCNRLLPGTPRCTEQVAPDVVIELAGMDENSSMPATALAVARASQAPFAWCEEGGDRFLLARYAGEGHEVVFCIRQDGTRLWCRWNALVGIEDITALLLGPMFVCLLQLRGHSCLHAAVLAVEQRAFALLGAKGAGKSSTALALVQQGAQLISDDVAVLDLVDRRWHVRRGLGRLRLRPQTAAALETDFDALPSVWSTESARPLKRYVAVGSTDVEQPATIPLCAIYLLGPRLPDAPVMLRPLGAGASLPLLMAHRHMQEMLDRRAQVRDFPRLADLAAQVPVFDVQRPEGVEHVHRIALSLLDRVRA